MSSLVNFLKNLLSGIFSVFGGLFRSKKSKDAIEGSAPKPRKARKSGYFLELEEAKGVGSAATPTKGAETAPSQASKSEPVQSKRRNAKAAVEPPKATPVATTLVAANGAALSLPQPTVTTFAPKYLAPNGSSNGRRRPGANMSSFLDMARQVKTSS